MASGNTIITATIAKVNANGFQTREDPGKWLNVSKLASPVPVIPPIGTQCQVTVDNAGYVRAIRAIEVLSSPPQEPDILPDAPRAPERPSATATTTVPDVRIAALGAAAAFLASRPPASSTDVLAVAERFEAWLTS